MKTKEIETGEAPVALEYPGLSGIAQEEIDQQEQVQGEADQAQASEVEQEQENNIAGWVEAVQHAASMITAMIPEATPVWSRQRQEALAVALAKCDDAYGWGGVGGLFAHPLIGLAFAAGPLIVGTAKAIKVAKDNQVVDVQAKEVTPEADPMGSAAAGPAAA